MMTAFSGRPARSPPITCMYEQLLRPIPVAEALDTVAEALEATDTKKIPDQSSLIRDPFIHVVSKRKYSFQPCGFSDGFPAKYLAQAAWFHQTIRS